MIVQVQGLFWETRSPSHYQLSPDHYDMKGQAVEVVFLGQEWCLFHVQIDDGIQSQFFPDRDSAIGVVASCFKSTG